MLTKPSQKIRISIFYISLIGLVIFEILNVYFIMPMPGSQEIGSLDLAYFLNKWRWGIRFIFLVLMLFGLPVAFVRSKWIALILLGFGSYIIFQTNFKMSADSMFIQPTKLVFNNSNESQLEPDRLIIGVHHNGESKAYPIQFLGYHHQVRDSIGGKQIMVTYCTVCRTGRVYEPMVNGKIENFRLVGMDHFNAMFEDETTKSWWRQATGEAVTGPLKGMKLAEFPFDQMCISQWLEQFPDSKIMQPDLGFQVSYDSMSNYEKGKLYGKLTKKDTQSWKDKSWVVGITIQGISKAYDWNHLVKAKIIHDKIEKIPIIIALSDDQYSFVAYERKNSLQIFQIINDTLITENNSYDFFGNALDSTATKLKSIPAYQEYWHSWREFHPRTEKYE